MEKQTYEHKGVTITFEPSRGDFTAPIGGKTVRASSLDAMKKRVDESAKLKFEPFKALRYSSDTLVVVDVTGMGKESIGYHRGSPNFMLDYQDHGRVRQSSAREVTPDTPEARERIKAWQSLYESGTAEIARIKESIEAALKAIPKLKALDYGTTKEKK